MLSDKKILLCVTGGIAIYKSVELASMLVKAGAVVKTVMTKSAMELVTPLTFKTITKETVSHKLFDAEAPIHHISLADWADVIVVAPATANIIGKLAGGIADDLLSTTVMAAKCPKLIVPAMNVNMWENPIVQENILKLKKYNYHILEPDTGRLACGVVGKGKMPSPEEIIFAIQVALTYKPDYSGKKVLITAGASIERIDPMRHITNISTGKMGIALARAASLRGGSVTIIHGKVCEPLPYYTENIEALSAQQMFDQVIKRSEDFDIIIMCAAVADYTPETPSTQKIKKADNLNLSLVRTKDILAELGKNKSKKQLLIGFAAESENLIENAKEKLIKKNLDMIIANKLENAGKQETEVIIISTKQKKEESIKGSKFEVANKILEKII